MYISLDKPQLKSGAYVATHRSQNFGVTSQIENLKLTNFDKPYSLLWVQTWPDFWARLAPSLSFWHFLSKVLKNSQKKLGSQVDSQIYPWVKGKKKGQLLVLPESISYLLPFLHSKKPLKCQTPLGHCYYLLRPCCEINITALNK